MISLFRCGALMVALAWASRSGEPAKIDFDTVAPILIQQRLELVSRKLADRKATLKALFHEVGCEGERLSEQRVPGSPAPNLLCTLPGEGDNTIMVGGHFDLVDEGQGAVDDWSGSVLLPSLYQSLKEKPRRHRFVFAAFAAEERGLWGSTEYVAKLANQEKARISAMVNLECLGLSTPRAWRSRADKRLFEAYVAVAMALHLQPMGTNVEKVGDDDSHPFLRAHIPVLTIHSLSQATLPVLHSSRDNLKAIHATDYYDAYRLAAAYLSYIDSALP